MKIEDQVVSLELAKKLKELGVKQESYLSWAYWHNSSEAWLGSTRYARGNRGAEPIIVAAFTVAEMGEVLPLMTESFKQNNGKWIVRANTTTFRSYTKEIDNAYVVADTEADARAKLLIYLLENNGNYPVDVVSHMM